MTFTPTYEELLARNEKYENAIRDAVTDLEHIEARLCDELGENVVRVLEDTVDEDISAAQTKLEKALQ